MTARKSRKSDIIYSSPINEVLLGGSNSASPQGTGKIAGGKKKKTRICSWSSRRSEQEEKKSPYLVQQQPNRWD